MAGQTKWRQQIRSMKPSEPKRGIQLRGRWRKIQHRQVEMEFGTVHVRLGEVGGRTVCTGIAFDDPVGIQWSALRDFPLTSIVAFLAEQQDQEQAPAFDEVPDDLGSRPTYTDEHFRRVAQAYRVGLRRRPEAPVRWIIETHLAHMEHPPSGATVRRWLREARRRGFVG